MEFRIHLALLRDEALVSSSRLKDETDLQISILLVEVCLNSLQLKTQTYKS